MKSFSSTLSAILFFASIISIIIAQPVPPQPGCARIGCSDGNREGFTSFAAFPRIAGCAGGWLEAGVTSPASLSPGCGRLAGNKIPGFVRRCTVEDLCCAGWHVCRNRQDVIASSGLANGCSNPAADFPFGGFFVTRQSGPGSANCGAGNNDLFGCGTVGATPAAATCAGLTRFSNNLCSSLPAADGWICSASNTFDEALVVTKPMVQTGGALCCRDSPIPTAIPTSIAVPTGVFPTSLPTPTPTPTRTPVPTRVFPTAIPTSIAVPTGVFPTSLPTLTPTRTPVPTRVFPTAIPTSIAVPTGVFPTSLPTLTPTITPVPTIVFPTVIPTILPTVFPTVPPPTTPPIGTGGTSGLADSIFP